MSWETLDRLVSLACLNFTFFHLYNECGIFAKVAAIIPFPVLIILFNVMAFQKLEVSWFTSSSGLALWLNLAGTLVETCADSEPRPKETLHASALCHGILTSRHVKTPRLTCWRMRDQVAQVSARPQPTQKLSCAADWQLITDTQWSPANAGRASQLSPVKGPAHRIKSWREIMSQFEPLTFAVFATYPEPQVQMIFYTHRMTREHGQHLLQSLAHRSHRSGFHHYPSSPGHPHRELPVMPGECTGC